jgi:hypothetical protein
MKSKKGDSMKRLLVALGMGGGIVLGGLGFVPTPVLADSTSTTAYNTCLATRPNSAHVIQHAHFLNSGPGYEGYYYCESRNPVNSSHGCVYHAYRINGAPFGPISPTCF